MTKSRDQGMDMAIQLFGDLLSVWVSFKRTYVLSLQEVERFAGYGIPWCVSLDDRLSWVFTWSYCAVCWRGWTIFLVSGNKLSFSELRPWADAAKGQVVQSCDLGRKILSQCGFYLTVSTLYHSNSHENELAICFYLSTSFAESANLYSLGKLKPICFEHRLAGTPAFHFNLLKKKPNQGPWPSVPVSRFQTSGLGY